VNDNKVRTREGGDIALASA